MRMSHAKVASQWNGAKRKRPKFVRKVPCHVCGDTANDHIHYGGIVCYSCKAFFRRKTTHDKNLKCKLKENCVINVENRKKCKACRLKKCFEVGLSKEWVMTKEDKDEMNQIRSERQKQTEFSTLTTYQLRLR